jgi:hypothetical protein
LGIVGTVHESYSMPRNGLYAWLSLIQRQSVYKANSDTLAIDDAFLVDGRVGLLEHRASAGGDALPCHRIGATGIGPVKLFQPRWAYLPWF